MDLREISDFNRVVIIDNDIGDGSGLQRALQKEMIASVFLHVNGLDGLPSKPFPNINLVFLDLDLINSVSNNRDKASRAIACLSKVVRPNSFYVLVIWSSHTTTELESDFREILENNNELMPCVNPIALAKLDCKDAKGNYSVRKINSRIRKRFNNLKAQSLFFKWEAIVAERMTSFINDVTKLDSQRDLSKKLHALADAYAGNDYKEDVAGNALFTLNGALKGSLDGAVAQNDLKVYNKRINKGVGSLGIEQKSLINSKLMIDPDIKLGPGCVYECLKCKFGHLTNIKYREDVIKVVINLTPICDAAQKKNQLNYYIHAALVPSRALSTIKSAGYVYIFQNQFQYNNKAYYIVVNLKSLEGIIKRKNPGKDERVVMKNECGEEVAVFCGALHMDSVENVLFKLRDPVVLDLQQKSSSHMSRFGHAYLV